MLNFLKLQIIEKMMSGLGDDEIDPAMMAALMATTALVAQGASNEEVSPAAGVNDILYRVTHLLADWVGLTWIWDVPLSCLGSTAAAVQPNGLWNIPNPSQPNPGPRGDGSPCTYLGCAESCEHDQADGADGESCGQGHVLSRDGQEEVDHHQVVQRHHRHRHVRLRYVFQDGGRRRRSILSLVEQGYVEIHVQGESSGFLISQRASQ